MASSSVWAATSPSARRRRHHLTSVVAVTIAFVVAASAVLVAVGSLTWPVSASAASPTPTAQPVTTPLPDDAGQPAPSAGDTQDDEDADDLPDEPDTVIPDPPAEDTVAPVTDTSTTPEDDAPSSEIEDEADGDETDQDEADETEGDENEGDAPDEPTLTTTQVQELLRDHGFLIGAADGRAGQQTTAAVMAYQRVNGLSVDGVVGPATTAALLEGSAEPSLVGGAPDRIEVDLDAQLLHLVEGGTRTVTLQVSSGNGETYTNANGTARARTPVGDFVIERRIHGLREALLGTLYDPLYFHRGFAIHGSPSVPPYPASHGCVRVTIADAAWLIQRVPDGTPVHVHGGTHVFTPSS